MRSPTTNGSMTVTPSRLLAAATSSPSATPHDGGCSDGGGHRRCQRRRRPTGRSNRSRVSSELPTAGRRPSVVVDVVGDRVVHGGFLSVRRTRRARRPDAAQDVAPLDIGRSPGPVRWGILPMTGAGGHPYVAVHVRTARHHPRDLGAPRRRGVPVRRPDGSRRPRRTARRRRHRHRRRARHPRSAAGGLPPGSPASGVARWRPASPSSACASTSGSTTRTVAAPTSRRSTRWPGCRGSSTTSDRTRSSRSAPTA